MKAFPSLEKFMASQEAAFSSQAETGIPCEEQDSLRKAGSGLASASLSSLSSLIFYTQLRTHQQKATRTLRTSKTHLFMVAAWHLFSL